MGGTIARDAVNLCRTVRTEPDIPWRISVRRGARAAVPGAGFWREALVSREQVSVVSPQFWRCSQWKSPDLQTVQARVPRTFIAKAEMQFKYHRKYKEIYKLDFCELLHKLNYSA